MRKQGCPTCAQLVRDQKQRFTIEEFLEKATAVHNNKYNYSKSIYKSYHTKIEIICLIHGPFWQEVSSHLSGCGCKQCAFNNIKSERLSNTLEFVNRATLIHNNKYSYSKANYTGAFKKIIIICKFHGNFLQSPTNHIHNKHGCPKCGYNISNPEIKFLNYINLPEEFRHKYIKPYKVDGYDPKTNTIYEFLGDYWHGNPELYDATKIHPKTKITFGEMYNKTIFRLNQLKSMGYIIKYVWENDWNKFDRGMEKTIKILEI